MAMGRGASGKTLRLRYMAIDKTLLRLIQLNQQKHEHDSRLEKIVGNLLHPYSLRGQIFVER